MTRVGKLCYRFFVPLVISSLPFILLPHSVSALDETKPQALIDNFKMPDDVSKSVQRSVNAAISAYKEWEESERKDKSKLRIAIEKLENTAGKASRVAVLYYCLGSIYNSIEKSSKAKRRLERAIKLNPNFYEAYVEYGKIFHKLRDYKKALFNFDKALEIYPSYAQGLENKGITLIRLGKFEDAKTAIAASQKVEKTDYRKSLLEYMVYSLKGPNWENAYQYESENYIVKTSISRDFAEGISEEAERIHLAYTKKTMSINYAQAWALIYFMFEGKKPKYKKALLKYFKALTKGKDIEEAYNMSFKKLNMKKFERDWKSFIKGIPN